MKRVRTSRLRLQLLFEVAVTALSPLLFFFIVTGKQVYMKGPLTIAIAFAAAVAGMICGLTLFRWPRMGKIAGGLSLSGLFTTLLPLMVKNPFAALLISVALILAGFTLVDYPSHGEPTGKIFRSTRFKGRDHRPQDFFTPAYILLITFFGLCCVGTMLLILPGVMVSGTINFIDAAFTSVSAVCVTGLVVLDTGTDFSLVGQMFILILIQLGGLGIMGLTTVALHAMGRRLSLREERLLTSMTDADHNDLMTSLVLILKFTFIAEAVGAIILTGGFYTLGDNGVQAVWRGVFTAVSAFCNAGFALQSDSLIPYRDAPLILHVVAGLIIFGGLAPATGMMVPAWISGRQIPVTARIDLVATTVLVLAGTFFVLIFEWNGILSGLSVFNKINNAWFQSVTLRTAGFNSVTLSGMMSPTFLIMLCFMFIGGCPGGTAGGVKATTVGILAMTFRNNLTQADGVTIQNRNIPSHTIYRAITIVVSGFCVWFIIVLMIEVTQQISPRDLLFEVTSALGTVGLSIGATARLDEMGKLIVMAAMFIGRIGPVTLFMLLRRDSAPLASRCPDAKINLT